MARDSKEMAALTEAIQVILPTAPPEDILESLDVIAEKHALNNEQTVELIRAFFAHFEIDVSGEPPMVILRSGYQVLAEEDTAKVVEHLRNAIIGDSTTRFKSAGIGGWPELLQEIAAEVEHVASATHEASVRTLLAHMLLEAAHAKLSKLSNDIFPEN